MKTLKHTLKTTFTVLLLATTLIGPVRASDKDGMPDEQKLVAAFKEGTQTYLSPEDIKTILPWAENSMTFLKQALEDINGQPYTERERVLLYAIKNVVLASAPKNSELLMRYVLNRGLRIHWLLEQNTTQENKQIIDTRVRVLKRSVELALKYWEMDLKHLKSASDNVAPIDFAGFGFEYSQFLYDINKSVLDATAQYTIMKALLGLFQWDMFRDSKKTEHAVDIKKINDTLTLYPVGLRGTDQKFISFVRRLKKVYVSLQIVQKRWEMSEAFQKEKARQQAEAKAKRDQEIANQFNVGDEVMYFDSIRTIEAVDNTGRLVLKEVRYKYSQTFVTVSEVSKILHCNSAGYCTGQKVLYGDSIREIEFVDNGNRVVLKEKRYVYSQTFVTTKDISLVK